MPDKPVHINYNHILEHYTRIRIQASIIGQRMRNTNELCRLVDRILTDVRYDDYDDHYVVRMKCGTCRLLEIMQKPIPLEAWIGPEGSRRLRLPDFKTIGT
jgi:hypothetical protein